jgi:hypothetical protein
MKMMPAVRARQDGWQDDFDEVRKWVVVVAPNLK